MNLPISVFDLFSHAIPGSMMLGLVTYIAARAQWVRGVDLRDPKLGMVLVIILASYLLGHFLYAPSAFLARRFSSGSSIREAAIKDFKERNSGLAGRPFVDVDNATLRAAIQMRSPDAAARIAHYQSTGIMLRSSAFVLVAAALTALVEIAIGFHPRGASGFAAGLLSIAVVAAMHGQRTLRSWAITATLETAASIEGIDGLAGD